MPSPSRTTPNTSAIAAAADDVIRKLLRMAFYLHLEDGRGLRLNTCRDARSGEWLGRGFRKETPLEVRVGEIAFARPSRTVGAGELRRAAQAIAGYLVEHELPLEFVLKTKGDIPR
jgi:hypothetical protein